jgi:hypothetical protein
MHKKWFVRDLATDRSLWDKYIDPSGQGGNDFNTMTTDKKMHMIVDLWPEDVLNNDEDGQRILAEIRRQRQHAASMLGKVGGRKISPAKSSAAKENGKKGGRPRKQPTS